MFGSVRAAGGRRVHPGEQDPEHRLMTSSTIPAARTNLVAGLAALQATTLAGVTVSRTGYVG
jgi:hypothetical protein